MVRIEISLYHLVNQELSLRFLIMMNAPENALRNQQSALETSRRKIREYEAKHGKIDDNLRKKVYNDYLAEYLKTLTLEQSSARCKNCTRFYENSGESPDSADSQEARNKGLNLRKLFEQAEMTMKRGCSLHPCKPDEIPSQECKDYYELSDSAEDKDLKQVNARIKIIQDFMAKVDSEASSR